MSDINQFVFFIAAGAINPGLLSMMSFNLIMNMFTKS